MPYPISSADSVGRFHGRLARLDDERLDAELAEVLGHSRLRALKRRREGLLEP